MTFKTIKELEAKCKKKYLTETVRGFDVGYLEALKEVLELINEVWVHFDGVSGFVEELKLRISGEDKKIK